MINLRAQFDGETARAAFGALLIVAAVTLFRTAWLSDDALITMRCMLNALHGYGPNFNIDERVQAFTHPLWFLCATLVTAIEGSPWVAFLLLSVGATMLSLWLLFFRLGGASWPGLTACCLALLSKAYIDYSSSGLETPLSNLLVLAVVAAGMRRLALGRQGGMTSCLCWFGLLYLNRADLVLLLAPFVAVVTWQTFRTRRELLVSLGVAAAPVLIWTLFSLIYYGFVVPNTAFAKLGGAIPISERVLQGWVYLFDSIGRDTVTLPVILTGMAIGLRRNLATAALSFGMLLYLAYVVRIGGDQMSGRFLVAPFVVAVALIAQTRVVTRSCVMLAGSLLLLGAINLEATLLSDTQMAGTSVAVTGIADERGIFFHAFGLVRVKRRWLRTPPWPDHLGQPAGVHVIECGGLGVTGYNDGPGVHVSDQCGLADPLMARLPAVDNPDWRIAHLVRAMPDGYRDSLIGNANHIADPKIANLYDAIRLVTRGALFTHARWMAILRLNLGWRAPGKP